MLKPRALTLAIIAGGRAERLGGQVKPMIRLGEDRVLDRLLSLRSLCSEVLIVAGDPTPYSFDDVRVVHDRVVGAGAPGGLVTALLEANTPQVLVIAGDMPFVTERDVQQLLTLEAPVRCFVHHGRLEGLCGVYAQSLGTHWLPLLAVNPSVRELLSTVTVGACVAPDARTVRSLNTPEDVSWACLELIRVKS